jgi:hypothetical protein
MPPIQRLALTRENPFGTLGSARNARRYNVRPARVASQEAKQIAAEEDRTRIGDTEHPAYSSMAKAMVKRRENLLVSAEQMNSMLDVLSREHLVVTLPYRLLSLERI